MSRKMRYYKTKTLDIDLTKICALYETFFAWLNSFSIHYISIIAYNFIHRKFQHKATGYNYRYPILSIDMYLSNIYQLQFNCYAFRMDSVTLRQFICGEPIEYINQAKYRSLYHLS